jgi:GNAT superfamily N-acetyltransferase
MPDLTISPLTPDRWLALEDLFGKAGASNGCWCMYWRLGPRYHERPRQENKHDLQRLAASDRAPGLLAFDGETCAGWCEVAPRSELGWLAHARHLRPVDDLPVWSVPCFFIRRSHRGRGVMAALIEAAVGAAAAAGAPALEAYPVDTSVPCHTGNLYTGVASAFAQQGFEVVARRKPDRPIMRKHLRPPAQAGPAGGLRAGDARAHPAGQAAAAPMTPGAPGGLHQQAVATATASSRETG